MWLLDANMDVHLVQPLGGRFQTLRELGVSCDTAANRGWKALSNGELVAAAAATGFTSLLTRDHLFGESAAHQEQFDEPVAGTLIHWPRK